MWEWAVVILVVVFALYLLYALFFWLFSIAINLLFIGMIVYKCKDSFKEKWATYLICAFFGLFMSLLIGNVGFLWSPTVFIILSTVLARILIYVQERLR